MKKIILILPLATAILSGCLPAKKSSSKTSGQTQTSQTGPTTPSTPGSSIDPGPSEYQGYRKVTTAPVDGKQYLLGLYQSNLKENLFFNGHHHTDSGKDYPFYLSMSTEVSKACKVLVTYTDDTHFTIKNMGGGEHTTYDGKYLRVYEGLNSKTGQPCASISMYDPAHPEVDPGDPSHTVTHSNDEFYFLDTYTETYQAKTNTYTLNTYVADLTYGSYTDEVVATGTNQQYENLESVTSNFFGTNFFAYFWEQIE